MPFPVAIPNAIIDTILTQLALFFMAGAGGDALAARQAAAQMLAGYHAETADELHLAAQIVSFNCHALEALSQAASPEMPLTKVLRLRSGAVSLSRQARKTELRLDQLRQARGTAEQAKPVATDPPPSTGKTRRPEPDQPLPPSAARQQIATAAPRDLRTWAQSCQQRLAAQRIADNLRKNQTAHLAAIAAAASAESPAQQIVPSNG